MKLGPHEPGLLFHERGIGLPRREKGLFVGLVEGETFTGDGALT
jgi:hypothetical protein